MFYTTTKCNNCGKVFSCDMSVVPMHRNPITQARTPLCKTCAETSNRIRLSQCMSPIKIVKGTYEEEKNGR